MSVPPWRKCHGNGHKAFKQLVNKAFRNYLPNYLFIYSRYINNLNYSNSLFNILMGNKKRNYR